ncbi:MAG: hypothetical protein NZM35_08135 [Chitinophagales bacterium]|nr:hypothetical protein [Chitinophagales bacterium]
MKEKSSSFTDELVADEPGHVPDSSGANIRSCDSLSIFVLCTNVYSNY